MPSSPKKKAPGARNGVRPIRNPSPRLKPKAAASTPAASSRKAAPPQRAGRRTTTVSIGGHKGSSCAELLALLSTYIDGGATPSICKALEGHLQNCNPCRVVVDNIRKTITLYRKDEPCELPLAFRARLHAAIRDCRKASFAARPKPRRAR